MAKIPKDLPKLPPLRSGTQKVIIFRKKDGEPFERWPVDAREMLATGEYTARDPSGVVPEGTVVEPEQPPEAAHDPAPQVKEAKEKAAREHSPGVPLNATTESTPEAGKPAAKKAAPVRKSQASKEAKEE